VNIFILNEDPMIAAREQCDKHVVKMIVESAQMLSTAHRMLDGDFGRRKSVSGKTMSKYWELPDSRERSMYKAVHMAHPCTISGTLNISKRCVMNTHTDMAKSTQLILSYDKF
jgi:hypothetical protein